jgi:hypothetical protein
MMRNVSRCIVAVILFALAPLAHGVIPMGTEEKGNKPLSPLNYNDWKGIMPIVNDKARVFQTWVNGNEWLFYEGGNEKLNATLVNFSKVEVKNHVVVLRPGPVEHRSFNGKTIVPYNWELHVVGGLAKAKATDDINDLEWQKDPVLTIFIGGEIDLERIKFPEGMTLRAAPGKSEEGKLNTKVNSDIEAFVKKMLQQTN